MIPARAQICITPSGVYNTSHRTIVPPASTLLWLVLSLKQRKNHLSFSLSLFSCLALFAWGINWPTLKQKILPKALKQYIRYSKHYSIADKIILLFSFAVELYVTQTRLLKSICLSKYFDSQSQKPVAKTAKPSGSVCPLFHATEKYAVYYILKIFSWRILSDCADASFADVVTCPCDNLQVLSPGHHSTPPVPDPLPSPEEQEQCERTSDSARTARWVKI